MKLHLSNAFSYRVKPSFQGELILSLNDIHDVILGLFLQAHGRELIKDEWASIFHDLMLLEDVNNQKQILELGINCKKITFIHNHNKLPYQREYDEKRFYRYQEISHIYHLGYDNIELPLEPLIYFMSIFDFNKIGYIDDLGFNNFEILKIRDYIEQKEVIINRKDLKSVVVFKDFFHQKILNLSEY